MAASLLDHAIYSYADVDRLVGLHSGTARRWLEEYERLRRFYDPVLRPKPSGSDAVTWGEMVEARLLADPLAHARPFLDVEGRELVQVVQEQVGLERVLQLVCGERRAVRIGCSGRSSSEAPGHGHSR